ncbi:hypothetical protein [Sulfolobus tengchongensis spindle-shaped virus 3]|nr:hypothetical protein [Sulfolobus tengchongensis spindle-shaped virus 3]
MSSGDNPLKLPSAYLKVLIVLAIFVPTIYFLADLILAQVTKIDNLGYQITSNFSTEGEQYYNKAIQQQKAFEAQGSVSLDIIVLLVVLFFVTLFILGLAVAIRRQES